jgi:hypothetical protein
LLIPFANAIGKKENSGYFAYGGSAHRLEVIENTRKTKYFAGMELSPVNAAKSEGFRGQTRAWSVPKICQMGDRS